MNSLCAGCENTGIGFGVMVLEYLGNHSMHDLAQLSLLNKRTDERQIVLIFRRCRIVFDVVIKQGVPIWRINEPIGLVDVRFRWIKGRWPAKVER